MMSLTARKFGKNGQQQGHLLLCKSVLVNLEIEYCPLPPGVKILEMLQGYYMPDQILQKKKLKPQCSGQNLTFSRPFPPEI